MREPVISPNGQWEGWAVRRSAAAPMLYLYSISLMLAQTYEHLLHHSQLVCQFQLGSVIDDLVDLFVCPLTTHEVGEVRECLRRNQRHFEPRH